VRLKALADALKEIMGRGQKAVGRSAGNLAAAHMPEMYETSRWPTFWRACAAFRHAFDFDAKIERTVRPCELDLPQLRLAQGGDRAGRDRGQRQSVRAVPRVLRRPHERFSGKSYAVATWAPSASAR
jgi:hypothetical protein